MKDCWILQRLYLKCNDSFKKKVDRHFSILPYTINGTKVLVIIFVRNYCSLDNSVGY